MADHAKRTLEVELDEAIGQADVVEVRRLIAAGADLSVVDEFGQTQLHHAARAIIGSDEERVQVLQLLIAAGMSPNAGDRDGHTPLMTAAGDDGNVAHVRCLIAAGAAVNAAGPDGWTALMVASHQLGDAPSVDCLLAAGADIHARTPDGRTALMLAVGGWPDAAAKVSRLLAAGADARVRTGDGRSLLDLARAELEHWTLSEPTYSLSRRTREFRDHGTADAQEVVRLIEAATR